MKAPWIKLSKDIVKSPIFDNPDVLKVWIWLLCGANFKESEIVIGNTTIKIAPGQAVISRKTAAKALGMTESKFYRLINLLTSSSQAVSSTNLVFDIVPARERTAAFALNSAVLGLIGFLTTLAVSPLVDYIQTNGNMFLGFNIFAQQLLAIISAFIIVILVIYYYTCCKRALEE